MKMSKIVKELGQQLVNEISTKDKAELEALIVEAEEAIRIATQERDANPHYQAAKQATKDLSEALRDVKKRQTAKIQLALQVRSGEAQEE